MNERENYSDRLTPRGAELLESLMGEMRDEVLQSAARRSVGVEISARDVIEAFEDRTGEGRVYSSALLGRRQMRLSLLLATYAATGAVLAVAAVIASSFDLGETSRLAPILAATSAAIVAASLSLLFVVRRREMRATARMHEEARLQGSFSAFMDRWLRIESLLRLLVARDLGSSAAEMPMGAVLDASLQAGRLDPSTYEALRKLLRIRNEAVHGRTVGQDALRTATRSADQLVSDFERELTG